MKRPVFIGVSESAGEDLFAWRQVLEIKRATPGGSMADKSDTITRKTLIALLNEDLSRELQTVILSSPASRGEY